MTRRFQIIALPALFTYILVIAAVASCGDAQETRLRVLIVDGQNNHDWRATTPLLQAILLESGRFSVSVATSPGEGGDMSGFAPDFHAHDVILSNYNGASWPAATRQAFVDYVRAGGGFVCVHAANNAFPEWEEYNAMIGLGGWGGRDERAGPYLALDNKGNILRDDTPGLAGNHGPEHEFQIVVRDARHPVTQGMPRIWRHAKDELYDRLRGPALHMHILATAYAPRQLGGRDLHEPVLMAIDYGRGRVFHTALGHAPYSMRCVGFATLLERGCEWAATGKVTIPIPPDFPSAGEARSREFSEPRRGEP
jgi:type 1 glutamine amidotransferase